MVKSIKSKSVRIARILAGGGTFLNEVRAISRVPVFAQNNFPIQDCGNALANSHMTASPKRNICLFHSAGLDFRGLPAGEEIMQTTRRTFLGAVGATAALGVADGAKIPEALAAEPRRPNVPAISGEK